jgi:predicted Rossmann fold nucleotide-binding protein DprA/Smf involved in DNA uptake
VDDILDELRWPSRPASSAIKSSEINGLDAIIQPGSAMTIEEMAAETGRQAADLLAELTTLELAGRVARRPGGTYVRLD